MTKQIFIFALTVLLCQIGLAQESAPVVLVASSGKVSYAPPGKKCKKAIADGAVLKRDGSLKLRKGSTALLLCGNTLQTLSGKQSSALLEVFPSGTEDKIRLSADRFYSEYFMAAVALAAGPSTEADGWASIRTEKGTGDGWGAIRQEPGKGTADGWGTIRQEPGKGTADGWGAIRTEKGTADGWGGKGQRVTAIAPLGNLLRQPVTLIWSQPAGEPLYRVQIEDGNRKVIAEQTTRDTFLTIDLADAKYDGQAGLQWSVATEGPAAARSNLLSLAIGSAAERTEAVAAAKRLPAYEGSPAIAQQLMEAVALERDAFYEEARLAYQQLRAAQPKHVMARLMEAAFLMRMGW